MRKHKLYLRPGKCEFEKTRIEYLGVIISHNKVEMDPVKIAGVADWPTPSNKKEVQSFVGFVNFYRCFIPGFSHHTRALFDLTMKDVRFIWGLPQEDSFMKLKELVTSPLSWSSQTMTYRSDQRPMAPALPQVLYSRNRMLTTNHGTPSLSCLRR
jgi:hypothetical protein